MKKFFTLIAAAIMAIGANAETIYSWSSTGADAVTETGGKATHENRDETKANRVNYANGEYFTICVNGKKGNLGDTPASDNASYIQIALDKALAAGDKILFTGYVNKEGEYKGNLYIRFVDDSKTTLAEFNEDDGYSNIGNGEAIATHSVVVPAEAAGSKTVWLSRNAAQTNVFLTKVEITREGGDTPGTPAVAKDLSFELSGVYPTDVYGNRQETVAYDHATTTATFKNFMGGTSDIVIKFVQRDGGKEINEVEAVYNSEFVSGFGAKENVQGFDFFPIEGLKDKEIVITNNSVNTIKLSNIKMTDGYSTTLANKGDGIFEITLYLSADSQGWDAATNTWGDSPAMAPYFWYKATITKDGEQAGIENIVASDYDENAPVEYYNLSGIRINEPAAGQIVIRRQGSKVTKIVIR